MSNKVDDLESFLFAKKREDGFDGLLVALEKAFDEIGSRRAGALGPGASSGLLLDLEG